jgi:type III secretion protein C
MTRTPLLFSLMVALLALLAALAQPALAAELPARGRSVRLEASEKSLPDFLRELAASQGVTAVIDPKINGSISGRFVLSGTESARKVLNSVCSANGLTWYYDGAFLYVDLAADARSEVMTISPINAGKISDTLGRLKISDGRYPLSVSEREGSVFVSGPKRYVEMVRQAVRLVDQRTALADAAEIRIFPLKYAWAADFKVHRSGGQLSIPGVTTVLRSMFGKIGGAGGSGARGAAGASFTQGASRQIKLSTGDTVETPKLEMGGPAAADSLSDGAFGGGELPQFHADTRMNAVLVRDMPDRMARYEKLVAAMDVKPRLVEIEVTIMDVSSDSLNSLGVDWRAHGRRADFQTGQGDRPALTWNGATTEAGQVAGYASDGRTPITPLGALFTAAIGHETRNYLLARVNALAQKGNANMVARPKVMTLDNSEALLENRSEFYVRVGGFQDSSLYKVNTGTAVRVTPLIVDESTGRGVMMSIDIEDGDIGSGTVDQIPIVRRRAVNTQALVNEGTSLLIAGYTSEEKSSVTSGVPLLSSIPLIGKLFQTTDKKQLNMERFYLLTPRMVSASGGTVAPPASGNGSPGE